MHSSSTVWPLRVWYVLWDPEGLIMCGLRLRRTELAGQGEMEMHRKRERLIHMYGVFSDCCAADTAATLTRIHTRM